MHVAVVTDGVLALLLYGLLCAYCQLSSKWHQQLRRRNKHATQKVEIHYSCQYADAGTEEGLASAKLSAH